MHSRHGITVIGEKPAHFQCCNSSMREALTDKELDHALVLHFPSIVCSLKTVLL